MHSHWAAFLYSFIVSRYRVGRRCGVGRGLGVGLTLGVGEGLGVGVGVGVGTLRSSAKTVPMLYKPPAVEVP